LLLSSCDLDHQEELVVDAKFTICLVLSLWPACSQQSPGGRQKQKTKKVQEKIQELASDEFEQIKAGRLLISSPYQLEAMLQPLSHLLYM
jgi:hypothetical protein